MRKLLICSTLIISSLTAFSRTAAPDTTLITSQLTEWFTAKLTGDTAVAPLPNLKFKRKDTPMFTDIVWNAWREANARLAEEKLPALSPLSEDSSAWILPPDLEPAATMKFRYGSKGEKPSEGYPLFLYLHGSGDPAREWANGLHFGKTFEDSPSAYFIPAIPNTGEWYRWYQRSKQFAWEKLLRQSMVNGDIDPNHIYFFGISEGGYGSQRLASFYADYLAGAGPMAGGEPLKNAPAENCRNIAFSFHTGDQDFGFYRDKLTRYTLDAFDSLRTLDSEGFNHDIRLIPGKGHAIDYRETTPWLSKYARNPWPRKVMWENFEMDGRKRNGFYNLAVNEPDSINQRTRYDMTIVRNEITLNVDRVDYTTIEKDPRWGIEMKFSRSYTPAKGGTVTIYLNSQLVDLRKPITIIVNGRKACHGKPKLTLENLANSCLLYFDPKRLFPAAVTVEI